jgi:ribosomal protein S18 acetylase RimI-like enzyme
VVIRDAELDDARGIAEVHVRSWQAAYTGIVPDEDLSRLSLSQREQFWTEILSENERTTLILLDGHLIAGWASFGPARDEDCDPIQFTELYGIYLLPEYWSTGCGKQLYRTIETRIRRNLIENLVLWVFEQNTRARRFYEAMGCRMENEKQKEMRFAEANPVQVRYRKLLREETNETGK